MDEATIAYAREGMTATLRHLLAAQRSRFLFADDAPPVPPGSEAIWDSFLALSAARPRFQGGVGPISYGEIEAYGRASGVRLRPFEVALIRDLDLVYVEIANRPRDKDEAAVVFKASDTKNVAGIFRGRAAVKRTL